MSCITCGNPYSLLRKEKGCPGCGFSYCSKCLDNKVFLKKKNFEAKVCAKCKRTADSDETPKVPIEPPDAYYKRLGIARMGSQIGSKTVDQGEHSKDYEIQQRLLKLREDRMSGPRTTDQEIVERLNKIKGEQPTASEEEIRERLAKLKGIPVVASINKVVFQPPDTRTDQEQANDLMKQYLAQTMMDNQYKEGFNQKVIDMESRLSKLKDGKNRPTAATSEPEKKSEDEEETVKQIMKKYKSKAAASAKALLASITSKHDDDDDDDISPSTNDELPFCEMCNEDATVRCLGCKYIFCKRCFKEHRDDDDGCNRYVAYKPPRT